MLGLRCCGWFGGGASARGFALAVGLALAACVPDVRAPPHGANTPQIRPDPLSITSPVYQYALRNGLQVVLNPDQRAPFVAVDGASSTIAFSRGVGLIEAHCSVAAEHTADAMREMSIEIARLRSGPLDERELARFKHAAIAQIPLMGISLESTVEALSSLAMFDRPANESPHLAEKIRQVSSLDVLRVARGYLATENLRWFLIGDASVVEKPLAQLELGPLRIEKGAAGIAAR